MPTSRTNWMVWTAASSSATKLLITGLPFQLIVAMSNPCSFRIMTPTPVLCKSSKTAPSKYSLFMGLHGGFQCSVRLICWPVTAWVVELLELQTAWNSCQNSIASPAMTLGCFVDSSETHLFLAFQIIQDSIRNCSTVLSQPSSNTGQNILTKSRNSCSNYLFSAAPNSLCLFTIP